MEKVKKRLSDPKTVIINSPKSLKKLFFNKKKSLTVVIATYNSKKFIRKCVESVINQTLPFETIELIIVDDCSQDGTPILLKEYSKEYKNITVVLLGENTGAAAIPRNIGIELSTTDRILFLDSDDWLNKKALSSLVKAMDETGDDVVIGQTIKVEDKRESIHAEFIAYVKRENCNAFDFPYLFYYMGPQSKLIKTSVIKDNQIRFEDMKFGEDKLFLYYVYKNSSTVGSITEPITYLNRLSDNSSSLTKTLDVLHKREQDLKILKEILRWGLQSEQEMVAVKRLVEYDLVKTCDSFVFVRSENKQQFISYIREALNVLENRPYDIVDSFDSPLYQVAASLVKENRDQDFINLFSWYKLEKNKKVVIQEGEAYYEVIPFDKNDPYRYIPIPLFVRSKDAYIENEQFVQKVEIYGKMISTIESVVIRDRFRLENEIILPIKINGNIGEFRVNTADLNSLESSLFSVFIRYNGYRLENIKRIPDIQITHMNREFTFYTTKVGNLGFSIKEVGKES